MGVFLLSLLQMFCFCYKSDSNSSSSDGSRARSVQSSAAPQQPSMVLESDEPRRSFGIKVQNLPVRSTGEWCCCFCFCFFIPSNIQENHFLKILVFQTSIMLQNCKLKQTSAMKICMCYRIMKCVSIFSHSPISRKL